MQRLFVALDLTEEIRQELAWLKMDIPGIRWVAKSQLHLTLRFIGDIKEEEYSRLLPELRSIKFKEFPLQLVGTGYYKYRGLPKILWAGVSDSPHLARLQEKVECACTSAGLSTADRPFSPHLTVARIKGGTMADVRRYITIHRDFRSSSFQVKKFYLYSSTLTKNEAIHRVIETVNAEMD